MTCGSAPQPSLPRSKNRSGLRRRRGRRRREGRAPLSVVTGHRQWRWCLRRSRKRPNRRQRRLHRRLGRRGLVWRRWGRRGWFGGGGVGGDSSGGSPGGGGAGPAMPQRASLASRMSKVLARVTVNSSLAGPATRLVLDQARAPSNIPARHSCIRCRAMWRLSTPSWSGAKAARAGHCSGMAPMCKPRCR